MNREKRYKLIILIGLVLVIVFSLIISLFLPISYLVLFFIIIFCLFLFVFIEAYLRIQHNIGTMKAYKEYFDDVINLLEKIIDNLENSFENQKMAYKKLDNSIEELLKNLNRIKKK